MMQYQIPGCVRGLVRATTVVFGSLKIGDALCAPEVKQAYKVSFLIDLLIEFELLLCLIIIKNLWVGVAMSAQYLLAQVTGLKPVVEKSIIFI